MTAVTTHGARYSVLLVELPGEAPVNAGVLLEDSSNGRLYARLRRDWDRIAPEEADVLSALEADLTGGAWTSNVLDQLTERLSNTVRITDPREVMVENFDRGLARLYREHVQSNVQEYVTHLPRYTLSVAAGPFRENGEVAVESWEEAPADLKLTDRMFVARIAGRSMEPRIPDGSLCVFRLGVVGSRDGRLVLIEDLRGRGNDRYTVKRYRSEKAADRSHSRITLESLNPEFESWDLDPAEDRFRILAEFVRVLD